MRRVGQSVPGGSALSLSLAGPCLGEDADIFGTAWGGVLALAAGSTGRDGGSVDGHAAGDGGGE